VFTIGFGKSSTELIFLVDIDTPSFEIVLPKYSILDNPNLHLDAFRHIFFSRNLMKSFRRRSMKSLVLSAKYTSDMKCIIPASTMEAIIYWKYDGARLGPNGNFVNYNTPANVINAVNIFVFKLKGAWW
jgi:hypothetical protein